MDEATRRRLIENHRIAIGELESHRGSSPSLGEDAVAKPWPPTDFYLLWHVVIGMMLGTGAALVSLLANMLGAPLFGREPLQLIRVYLTFPMGAEALQAERGLLLFVGCALYLATGAVLGVFFHLFWMARLRHASMGHRFLMATLAGLGLWIFNFYLLLSWLQPVLLDGNWIVEMVPWWVGALTHLAFTWTLAAFEVWGRFEPSHRPSD